MYTLLYMNMATNVIQHRRVTWIYPDYTIKPDITK